MKVAKQRTRVFRQPTTAERLLGAPGADFRLPRVVIPVESNIGTYILDEQGEPVPCRDLMAWGLFMQDAKRRVAEDTIGENWVSTVFLGLDHSFCQSGPPVLYESMVFGPDFEQTCHRYCTRDEAQRGHAALVQTVKVAVMAKGQGGAAQDQEGEA